MKTKYTYNTEGTCCKKIFITIDDDNKMSDIVFIGGCPGNLNAIKTILEGKEYTEFLGLFHDNKCGARPTSCMMQFDNFLNLIKADKEGSLEYPEKQEV